MINLEELRKENALKIEAAEIENRLEEETGLKCNCYPFTWKGKTVFHASFSDSLSVLSIENAAKVINMLPQTEEISLRGSDGEEFQRYKLTSIRGYRDRFSKLEIKYLSNGIEISFSINLEENADIRGLFITGERRLTDGEISTYNIRGSRSTGKIREMRVPSLRFSGGKQICYYGGNVVCNENAMINQVISAIQYAGEFSSKE